MHHISAWDALSGIHDAMAASGDFAPTVISLPFNFDSQRQGIFDGEDGVHHALEAMKVPHRRFNFQDHAEGLAQLKAMQPDILFRQSPWDADIPPAYATDALGFTRLVYTDYGIGILQDSPENIRIDYDQALHRRAWMLLCANEEQKRIYETRTSHKGVRAVVTGYPKFDRLVERGREQKVWPVKSAKSAKRNFRLIWAPHHSVHANHLGFGTFPFVFQEIMRWIFRHPDVDVVLKPHPTLFESCAHGMMTKDNVKTFLEIWESLPNTAYVTGGDYGPLFAASDAMLTDGITFLVEYQLFGKPLIWLDSGRHIGFNSIGEGVLDGLHIAKSATEALGLIEEIRKRTADPLQEQRAEVVRGLMPYAGASAPRVLDAIREGLRGDRP